MANVNSFEDIREDFLTRVEKIVWCNVATVDSKGRPRSRVLHPIWEGATGWIMTSPQSLKANHLAETPYISMAYIADPFNPIYVEATVEWIEDATEKKRVWDLFTNTTEPYGYDPTPFFESVESPNYGLLKITPWMIELYDLLGDSGRRWKA